MTGTDIFAVEGTSVGEHKDGSWRAGVTHAGRWCDVFEVRDFLIQRCFIYLDPDYAGLDTARYHWLSAGGRDPSKPMAYQDWILRIRPVRRHRRGSTKVAPTRAVQDHLE